MDYEAITTLFSLAVMLTGAAAVSPSLLFAPLSDTLAEVTAARPTGWQLACIPLASSAALLALALSPSIIPSIFLCTSLVSSCVAWYLICTGLIALAGRRATAAGTPPSAAYVGNTPPLVPSCLSTTTRLLVATMSTVPALVYLTSGGRHGGNVVGASLVVASSLSLRLPSLRLAAALLLALLVYDVFWVFGSELLWGHNVMVEAARKEGSSPVRALGMGGPATLPLPIKLVVEPLMLGLGDMAIPAMLSAYARRVDDSFHSHVRHLRTLFPASMVGYAIGLAAAFYAAFAARLAQPALLYIVPSQLLVVSLVAWRSGCFSTVWQGSFEEKEKRGEDEEGVDSHVRSTATIV